MINETKRDNALYTLHLIMARARFLAYQSEDPKTIATMLDYAEDLPRLIASPDDKTEQFRQALEGLAEEVPYGTYFLNKFDGPAPVLPW